MVFMIIAGVLALLGLLGLMLAAKMLLKRGWLLAWLRGNCGVLVLVAAMFVGLCAIDIMSYQDLKHSKPLGTISFKRVGDKLFDAQLVMNDGSEQGYQLEGDQWQLSARFISWQAKKKSPGFGSGYRLHQLEGRFYDIALHNQNKDKSYFLEKSQVLDVWAGLHNYGQFLGLVKLTYDSATFKPMADGAIYRITLNQAGLVSEPFNEQAHAAVNQWQ